MTGAKMNMFIFSLSKSVLETKNVPVSARIFSVAHFYNFKTLFLKIRSLRSYCMTYGSLEMTPIFREKFSAKIEFNVLATVTVRIWLE